MAKFMLGFALATLLAVIVMAGAELTKTTKPLPASTSVPADTVEYEYHDTIIDNGRGGQFLTWRRRPKPVPEPRRVACYATHFADRVGASSAYSPDIPCVAYWGENLRHDSLIVWSADGSICNTFPILDRGPARHPIRSGVYVDLTGPAFKKYAPLSQGRVLVMFRPLRATPGWSLPSKIEQARRKK